MADDGTAVRWEIVAMSTPVVTENRVKLQSVDHDTFIDDTRRAWDEARLAAWPWPNRRVFD